MVLVLFFLLVTIVIFLTSVLWMKIDIRNLKLYKKENLKKRTNKDYEIIIGIYVFRKMKIFQYKINDKKVKKKYFKKLKNKLDIKTLRLFITNNYDYNNLKKIEIEKLKLYMSLGIDDVILTSGVVTLINIFIPIILSKTVVKSIKENYKYEVKPIYQNKNELELFLDLKVKLKLFSLFKALKSYILAKKNKKFLERKYKYQNNVNINTNIVF